MISVESLRERVSYNPETGSFLWRESGRDAFSTVLPTGNRQGCVSYKKIYAHRAAWAIHHGEWPNGQIDHINGDRADNRIANLRVVTKSRNMRNAKRRSDNTSGFPGVIWAPQLGKWRAVVQANGKPKHLGVFERKSDAIAARKAAEKEHGYHENHGRAA